MKRLSSAVLAVLVAGCSLVHDYPVQREEVGAEACMNGRDDDLDGRTDCDDDECRDVCPGRTREAGTYCLDGVDNDRDARPDHHDAECWPFAEFGIRRCASSVASTIALDAFDSWALPVDVAVDEDGGVDWSGSAGAAGTVFANEIWTSLAGLDAAGTVTLGDPADSATLGFGYTFGEFQSFFEVVIAGDRAALLSEDGTTLAQAALPGASGEYEFTLVTTRAEEFTVDITLVVTPPSGPAVRVEFRGVEHDGDTVELRLVLNGPASGAVRFSDFEMSSAGTRPCGYDVPQIIATAPEDQDVAVLLAAASHEQTACALMLGFGGARSHLSTDGGASWQYTGDLSPAIALIGSASFFDTETSLIDLAWDPVASRWVGLAAGPTSALRFFSDDCRVWTEAPDEPTGIDEVDDFSYAVTEADGQATHHLIFPEEESVTVRVLSSDDGGATFAPSTTLSLPDLPADLMGLGVYFSRYGDSWLAIAQARGSARMLLYVGHEAGWRFVGGGLAPSFDNTLFDADEIAPKPALIAIGSDASNASGFVTGRILYSGAGGGECAGICSGTADLIIAPNGVPID